MFSLLMSLSLVVPLKASAATTLVASANPGQSIGLTVHTVRASRRAAIVADGRGRVRYAVPADATAIDFVAGDQSAHLTVEPARAKAPPFAFVAPPTAFDRDAPATLDVRGFDPLHGSARADGAGGLEILAASDRSIVARFADSTGLGAHALTLSSGRVAFTARVFLVKAQIAVGGPAQVGATRPVTFTVDGLGDEPARVDLALTGDAVFANNEPEIVLPVEEGKAETTMRAKTGYGIDLKWHLDVAPRYRLGYDLYETPAPHASESIAPTPTPLPCRVSLDDGAFEAMQGVYQDDPAFQQKPDVLRREDGPGISYYGELDMIKGRPTKLVGVDRYVKDGVLTPLGERDHIFLRGTTNCSEPVPVRMRFTLYEHGASPRVLETTDVLTYINLRGGARGGRVPWRAQVGAYTGRPEGATFQLTAGAEHYAIKAELVDDKGRETGLLMWLNGYTSVTTGPLIRFIPIVLTHTASPTSFQDKSRLLLEDSHRLRGESYDRIPDIYPLKPFGLPMPIVAEPLDLTGTVLDESFGDMLRPDVFITMRHEENLRAALADRLSATTVLEGVGRTVAVMTDGDFAKFLPDANGVTLTTKLVAVRTSRAWTTVAHEVAHTLPAMLWSKNEMLAQCGKDYHNLDPDVAYGMQLTRANAVITPERHNGYPWDPMQGPSENAWISQCTYANLIEALKNGTDPPILLARFFVSRPPGAAPVAAFKPAYETSGVASPDGNGTYALVALTASGALAREVRFEPQWVDDDGVESHIVAVQIRLAYDPRIARLEVRRGSAVLAAMTMSATPPTVGVDDAWIRRRVLHVRWHGSVERGRKARFTLFTSMDGRWYDERLFEVPATQATLPVVLARFPKYARVVVTDGSRNAQATRIIVRR